MKDENEFNAYLSKEFRKLRNSTKLGVMKMSERFQAGASDFLLVKDGKTILLESKFIKELPAREDTQILSHPFTGPQIKFMDDLALGGALCFGLIGIKSLGLMAVIPHSALLSGNWSKRDFGVLTFEYAHLMDWKNIPLLISVLSGVKWGYVHDNQQYAGQVLRVLVG